MRTIEKVIVHCSATKPSMSVDAALIREWHVEERGWRDIGYHFVICRDGSIEVGRPITESGAHCKGHNSDSIGVCLVGGVDEFNNPVNNFLAEQFRVLHDLIKSFEMIVPGIDVDGHHDFDKHKPCPCFDVRLWYASYSTNAV